MAPPSTAAKDSSFSAIVIRLSRSSMRLALDYWRLLGAPRVCEAKPPSLLDEVWMLYCGVRPCGARAAKDPRVGIMPDSSIDFKYYC